MSNKTIAPNFQIVNQFVETLQLQKKALDLGLKEIEEKEKSLAEIIQKSFRESITQCFSGMNQDSEFKNEINTIKEKIEKICSAWEKNFSELQSARKFIGKFEKTFLITVFGKVNAGKSSLGNFVLGHSFKKAPFDNVYKNIEFPLITIHDQTSVSHMREAEKKERIEMFEENATEATSVIQSFSFESLSWVDTPGIGAVKNPALSERNNEDLAKQYVNYADLVIFLMPSDAPGVQQEFEELKLLKDNKKQVLLIISKSDEVDEDVDDEGELVSMLKPKSKEDRKKQEDYLREELKKAEVIGSIENAKTLSISVQLAKESLKKQDAEMFKDSGLVAFYELLMKIFKEKFKHYKEKNPQANFNRVIDGLIKTNKNDEETDKQTHQHASLSQLEETIEITKESIKKVEAKINKLKAILPEEINNKLEYEIGKVFNNISVGDNTWQEKIRKSVQTTLNEMLVTELKEELKELANNIQETSVTLKMDGLKVEKKIDRVSYKVDKEVKRQREPEGFWENTADILLDKKYYKYEKVSETKYIEIDLGTNEHEVREKARKIAMASAQEKVIETFDDLEKNVLQAMSNVLNKLCSVVEETKKKLEALKFGDYNNNNNKA